MILTVEPLNKMTPTEDEAFWASFEAELAHDDGAEAARHLAAGNPIYFCEPDTPENLVIKEYPDGRRELVSFDLDGEKVVRTAA
jgi:hypothetical protein